MKIFVLTVHFGSDLKLTTNFVNSFFKYEKFDELVISNNNKDSLNIPNRARLKIINNGKNLSWGGGINKAIDYSFKKKADFVFVVNNDCLLESSILRELLNFLKKNENTIVGPVLKYHTGKKVMFDLGGFIDAFSGKVFHKDRDMIKNKKPIRVDFTGTFLFSREILNKIKGFDERYFLYYDDVDLCLRAQNKGIKTYILPTTQILHKTSSTIGINSKKAIYHQTRSAIIFWLRYYNNYPKKIIFPVYLLGQITKRFVTNPKNGVLGYVAILDYFFLKKIRFI